MSVLSIVKPKYGQRIKIQLKKKNIYFDKLTLLPFLIHQFLNIYLILK